MSSAEPVATLLVSGLDGEGPGDDYEDFVEYARREDRVVRFEDVA